MVEGAEGCVGADVDRDGVTAVLCLDSKEHVRADQGAVREGESLGRDRCLEAMRWEEGIDALASDDDDMTAYIEGLEQARDAADAPEAKGEAIAEEFEKYLQSRPDRPTAGEG